MQVRKPNQQEIEKTKKWGEWTKEPSVFSWEYDDQETCYILEGKATVKAENGETINFGMGDWVVFEKGLKCTWEISETIRKKYLFG